MKTLQKMYEHLDWANRHILEALKNADIDNLEAIRLFGHLLYAEQAWLSRLHGKDSSRLPLWSNIHLTECARMVEQNHNAFAEYFSKLEEAALDEVITYNNQFGKEFQAPVRDILIHLALHGQYHRGQINSRLRFAGGEPANVDYITYYRNQ